MNLYSNTHNLRNYLANFSILSIIFFIVLSTSPKPLGQFNYILTHWVKGLQVCSSQLWKVSVRLDPIYCVPWEHYATTGGEENEIRLCVKFSKFGFLNNPNSLMYGKFKQGYRFILVINFSLFKPWPWGLGRDSFQISILS